MHLQQFIPSYINSRHKLFVSFYNDESGVLLEFIILLFLNTSKLIQIYKFKGSKLILIPDITDDPEETCKYCNQSLNGTTKDEHNKLYHQEKCHVCSSCKKEYKDLKTLKRHIRVHKYATIPKR